MGRRNRPFFRLNAVESRTPRGGRIIEKLGHYDPIEKDIAKQLVLNKERIQYWLDKGAIPSDTVSQILLRQGIKTKYAKERSARRAKARALARKKGLPFNKAEKAALQKQTSPPSGVQAPPAEKKAEPKAEAKAEPPSGVQAPPAEKKAEAAPKAEPKAEAKAEPTSGVQAPPAEKKAEAAPKAEPKAEAKAESKAEGKAESKAEDKPEDKKE